MNVSIRTATNFIRGDDVAAAEVYQAYRKLPYFIIVAYVKTKEDAEDVYQETFTRVLTNRSTIASPSALHSYLCQTARNCAIDCAKNKEENLNPEVEESLGENEPTPLESLLPLNLSVEEKTIAGYRIGFGLSWKEISELISIPMSTAKLHYHEAKKKIKETYSK
jgi:RNA polymerase sigma factor, sigma-70 family